MGDGEETDAESQEHRAERSDEQGMLESYSVSAEGGRRHRFPPAVDRAVRSPGRRYATTHPLGNRMNVLVDAFSDLVAVFQVDLRPGVVYGFES